MLKRISAFLSVACATLALSLPSATACAQPKVEITPATQAALDRITADDLRGHLSFIASDLLEGRATPSPGLDIAAEYIAAQFRRAGLEPIGDDGYFQTATYRTFAPNADGFLLSVEANGKNAKMDSAAANGNFGAWGVDLTDASVVCADWDKPEILRALAAGSLAGKVLFLPELPVAKRNAAFGQLGNIERLHPSLLLVADPFIARALMRTPMQSVDAPHASSLAIVNVAGSEVAPLISNDAHVSVHVAAPKERTFKVHNVAGVLRGSDPVLSETYVMVTAHYDHIGTRPGTGDTIFNGANDDGSGTVSVIEIAGALSTLPVHPKRSILFMTFFGEELGLVGSRYYGTHPLVPVAETVADVNLEQVGRTDASNGPQIANATFTGYDFTTVPATFKAAGEAVGVKVYKDAERSDPFFARSDNQALADQGVPAHTICVAFEYPDYHGVGDSWDKVDYVNMAKVDRMVALGLVTLASDPVAPTWNESDPKTKKYVEAAKKLKP